jgi:molecular chaperone DnaK
MPQIEVTFDIDANGIVHVSAKDLGTGKEQSMTITGGSALPKDDIEQMIKDAEAHADEDRKRREAIELRNQADTLVYQTDKTLKEHGDKLDEATQGRDRAGAHRAEGGAQGRRPDAIKTKMEALGAKSQQLAEAIYAASQAPDDSATAGTAEGGTGSDDEVVDAEVVDEGDEEQQAG